MPHRPVLHLHNCYHLSSCGQASSMSLPSFLHLPATAVWSEPWLFTHCPPGSPAPLPRVLAALFHQTAAVGNLAAPRDCISICQDECQLVKSLYVYTHITILKKPLLSVKDKSKIRAGNFAWEFWDDFFLY